MNKYFGTDGVRGIANLELTPELVYKLGRAGAYILSKEQNKVPTIIVGKDTRLSGDMLETALVAGMCSVGAKAICIGVAPTPTVPYLIKEYNADAGVVISASHNHFKDNGIKFFNNKGFKISDKLEQEIESIIDDEQIDLPRPIAENLGYKQDALDSLEKYVGYLKTTIDVDFTGLNVCIDCANGATYKAAPMLFEKLGANLATLNVSPNGVNINEKCGSTHMEGLSQFIKENKGFVGIAFDGDGDRCLAVDENGETIDGDQIMAICSLFLKEQGRLKNNSIVSTVMSNLGLSIMGKENNINIFKSSVGDRYVLETMLKEDCVFGGEQSGHIIFLDYNTTGDGILTAIQLLAILKKTKKPLSELKKAITLLPQVLVNAKVNNQKKNMYLDDLEIKKEIEKLENKFAGEGRVLIRPSGTEPIVRVMIEGKVQEELEEDAKNLAKLIEKKLN